MGVCFLSVRGAFAGRGRPLLETQRVAWVGFVTVKGAFCR